MTDAPESTRLGLRTKVFGSLLFPFRYWNWKTASITAAIRGFVFLAAIGRHNGQLAALVEVLYVVLTSGFFSAVQQGLLGVRPRLARNFGIVVCVPVLALGVDCLVHAAAGASNPRGVTIGVLGFSLISALFHLHVMQNGTMLTGGERRSFLADLKALPQLVVSFVCAPFKWGIRLVGPRFAQSSLWEASGAE